jgi:acyl carrier protein
MRDEIIAEMHTIAKEQKIVLKPIVDDQPLADFGFDSLCFAILVARLDDRFGIDPFATSEEMNFPVTVGDFIALYQTSKIAA